MKNLFLSNVRELERRSGPYCSLGSFGETGGPLALLPFVGRCSGAHGESTAVQQAAMDSEKFILKQPTFHVNNLRFFRAKRTVCAIG